MKQLHLLIFDKVWRKVWAQLIHRVRISNSLWNKVVMIDGKLKLLQLTEAADHIKRSFFKLRQR